MYVAQKFCKEPGAGYMTLSIGNLFVGANTTAITFFLNLPIFTGFQVRNFVYS